MVAAIIIVTSVAGLSARTTELVSALEEAGIDVDVTELSSEINGNDIKQIILDELVEPPTQVELFERRARHPKVQAHPKRYRT